MSDSSARAPRTALESARDYLARELGAAAPTALRHVASFDEHPLDGEGAVEVFMFEWASGSGDPPTAHFVVAGATTPNYFPAYDLDADDLYSLHIGTRFALVVGLMRLGDDAEPDDARARVRAMFEMLNPGEDIERMAPGGVFQVGEETHVVYELRAAGQLVYAFGGDCPPGFRESGATPPAVALRVHLGRMIREEARVGDAEDEACLGSG